MKQDKSWSPAHEKLRESMQQEVSVLRELLANLFQEEVFLSQKDPKRIYLIQEDRTALLKILGALRKERLITTKEIKTLFQAVSSGKKLQLEELLPQDDENSAQVISLRDQMHSLLEKMNDQKERNHHLHHEWTYLKNQPLPLPKKKKSAIATFEEKR